MNEILSKRLKLQKAVSTFAMVATVFTMSGGAALAVAPADFGLTEGDTISANNLAGDPDVYIVNDWGYKRLFLNPVIFGFYGHLGFDKVKQVSAATRDAFVTSGLFRNCEAGDERVYGVETTGEDTGTLHWVNMTGSAAVAEDADFFKKVFCINNNEYNWYTNNGTTFGSDYTALSQVPDYARGQTQNGQVGPVSVSLAPGSPAARTVTTNAQGVEMLRIRLTGTGTVNELKLTRGGAGANSDISNVYLYEGNTRLTSARSLASSTGTVQFVNLGLAVNGTRDISVLVDLSATAGNVHNIGVATAADVGLSGGVSAGGSYPVTGSNNSVAGTSGGTITVNKVGTVTNPTAGQSNVKLSEFKLTTATEGGLVKRMRFIQGGTVDDSNLKNIVVRTIAGVQVGSGTVSNGYVDIVFAGNGYMIAKGDSETFRVFGDVNGKVNETIKLYLEIDADTHAIGDQFGFGMAVTDDELDTSGEAHSLTLQGGALTIAFNGPSATNVGTDTSDTVLANYTWTAESNLEVKKVRLVLCKDDTGSGTYNNAADTTNGWDDLDDIKIKNADTGAILVGPADGSAFTASEATGCPDSATGAAKTFTDAFDILAGQTLNLQVTGDIKTANSGSGVDLAAGDIFKVVLDGYGESDLAGSSGDITVLRYTDDNTAVDDSDIVPNTDLSGNEFTLQASALTLGLAGAPASQTNIKGATGIDAAGFTLAAGLASDLQVTDITLSGYVADSGSTLELGVGTGADSSLSVSSLVSAVRLYDGDTGALLSGVPASNNLNNSTGTVQFNNLNWVIPAGSTKTLLVKVDLSSNATSGSSDVFSFDVNATSDITAVDNNGTTVNPGTADPNGATSPTVIQTVGSAGTLNLSAAPGAPISKALYWGQTGAEVSRFRLTSTNEAFHIEKLTFGPGSGEATDAANNVKSITLEYTNEAGSPVTVTQSVSSVASANFGFSGANRPYVPKDSSLDVVVKANLKTKAEGATSTGAADATSPVFSIDYQASYNGSTTDGFRAVGAGSGTVLTGGSSGVSSDTAANNMYVYRVFPKFTQVAVSSGEPLGTKDVFKFTIEAMGLSDSKLFFDNTAAGSGSIKFEVVASGQAAQNMTLTLYDNDDGSQYDSVTASTFQAASPNATASFDFTTKDLEITGGQTKTLRIEASFAGFNDQSDYFQLILRDDESGLINWVDNSAGASTDPDVPSVNGVLRQLPLNGPTFSKL